MPKKQKNLSENVFFNASVVLAGLKNSAGGSGKLLSLSKIGKINGVISEIVLDEVLRHTAEIDLRSAPIRMAMKDIFSQVHTAPEKEGIARFTKIVVDPGDAHVLASCYGARVDFLVTLDKKHLLVLQKKIKWVKIVSPGELIGILASSADLKG